MENFQARKYKEALALVDKADELLPATPWSLNIRGAVAIEQRNFADGVKYCAEALKLDANFFPAEFNLGEIPFLQGKYAESREAWGRIIARTKKDDSTLELLSYRVFLTYLLEKDPDHAKEWLEKIPFPSKTPAYDYAHAAWERQQGNNDKWEEWLRSARSTWSEAKRASFTDVLIQMGWLKPE
jgi:tetratricopeptide (TPR) repeat protein